MGTVATEESLLNKDISTLVYPQVEGSETLDSWPQVRKGRSIESTLPGSYLVIWQTYISLPGNRCKVINQAQWGFCCLRHKVVFGDIEEGTGARAPRYRVPAFWGSPASGDPDKLASFSVTS